MSFGGDFSRSQYIYIDYSVVSSCRVFQLTIKFELVSRIIWKQMPIDSVVFWSIFHSSKRSQLNATRRLTARFACFQICHIWIHFFLALSSIRNESKLEIQFDCVLLLWMDVCSLCTRETSIPISHRLISDGNTVPNNNNFGMLWI